VARVGDDGGCNDGVEGDDCIAFAAFSFSVGLLRLAVLVIAADKVMAVVVLLLLPAMIFCCCCCNDLTVLRMVEILFLCTSNDCLVGTRFATMLPLVRFWDDDPVERNEDDDCSDGDGDAIVGRDC
jgi:hypothetical protein